MQLMHQGFISTRSRRNAMVAADLRSALPELLKGRSETTPAEITLDGGTAVVVVSCAENIACQCISVSLARHRPHRDCAELRKIAHRLSDLVTYLPYRLTVYEADAISHSVMLRSCFSKANQPLSYYEVLIDRERLFFTSYSHTRGEPRKVTSTALTMEVLAQLLIDCDQVLS